MHVACPSGRLRLVTPLWLSGMTRIPFGALIALALASAFLVTWPFRGDLAQSVAVTTMTRPLAHATSWRFVPGAVDVTELEADRSNVLVIGDQTISGRDLTEHDIAAIKNRVWTGSRLLLAYIDITDVGPASSIWDQAWGLSRPAWSDGDSCDVANGMRVKFWDADWKALIFRRAGSLLDRAIAQGFDGVYAGGLTSFAHFNEPIETLNSEAVRFMAELAAVARKKKQGVVIMSDGNAALLAQADFRAAVDGVGIDGLLYGRDGQARRPVLDIWSAYSALRPLQADGKPVFAVEHVISGDIIDQATRELRRRGIVPGFEPSVPARGDHCAH